MRLRAGRLVSTGTRRSKGGKGPATPQSLWTEAAPSSVFTQQFSFMVGRARRGKLPRHTRRARRARPTAI